MADTDRSFFRRVYASRIVRWVAGTVLGLLVLLFIVSFFLDEPLRKAAEKNMNRHLKGYSVRLPGLHLQLIGLTLTLKDLTVIQQAHPETPVAVFSTFRMSVHWREILAGRLVAELWLDQPKLHINLKQLRSQASSDVPLKERGWQEAVLEIYPLKINRLVITNGSLVYIDQDPQRPLALSRLNFTANNIRNIHLPDKVYPSTFHLDTAIFDGGHGSADGRANFLAEPHVGLNGTFKLENIPISYFKPVVARSNLSLKGGVLNVAGTAEYAPAVQKVHLTELEVRGLDADYIHSAETAAKEKKRAEVARKAAKEVSNKPDMLLRIDRLRLAECTLGMQNRDSNPPYRVFLSDTSLTITNLSNHFTEGPAEARLQGKFMGSGTTVASARFRPEKQGPDLDLSVKISNTRLTSLNQVLRAYGNFDVVDGSFSFVSELRVKNNQISGYIKPFFQDMHVYDKRQDQEKGAFHKLYEMLVGGVAGLLENRPRTEVATKTDISGPLQKPQMSTWQTVVALIRNAFFRAILPTFEREVTQASKRK